MTEISTKEGWREHVDTVCERPAPVTVQDLRAMSFGERAMYNQGRAQFSQAGAFVRTPHFQTFHGDHSLGTERHHSEYTRVPRDRELHGARRSQRCAATV